MGIHSLHMLGEVSVKKGFDEIISYQCFSFLIFGDLSSRKPYPVWQSAFYSVHKQRALKLVVLIDGCCVSC